MKIIGTIILFIFSLQIMTSVSETCCFDNSKPEKVTKECPHHQSNKANQKKHHRKKSPSCQKLCCLNIVAAMEVPSPVYIQGYFWQTEYQQIVKRPKNHITPLFRPPIA
jgi:hypothetical protein